MEDPPLPISVSTVKEKLLQTFLKHLTVIENFQLYHRRQHLLKYFQLFLKPLKLLHEKYLQA